MTRVPRVAFALLVLASVFLGASPGPASADTDEGRVLLFTVPGLTWADLQTRDLPVIEEFLEDAAVANHAPRGARVRTDPGGAYLTIGSGGRAIGDRSSDGQVLSVDDTAAGTPAGEIFERRTGSPPNADWVLLNWPDLEERNAEQPYDVELGSLVAALGDAGLGIAAIGNSDGADTLEETYEREVGLAAANADGAIVRGRFGPELILDGPEVAGRPFGRKVDTDAYVAGFGELWADPAVGVVVAEASDLARTMRYRGRVDTDRYAELWNVALDEADQLFGRLLEHVDPGRDTVILLAPYNLPGDRDLTVAAMVDPERATSPGGYLRSASTQRSGYVTLVDVGPTILDVLGAERPAAMEGRPFVVTASDDALDDRIDRLVSGNAASRFRENLLVPTTVLIVVGIGVVCALAIACLAQRSTPRWTTIVVSTAGLAVMLVFPMSFAARGFSLEDLGMGFYWSVVVGSSAVVAVALGAVASRLRRPQWALIGALAVVALVIGLDVVSGSRLAMSAPFGYSPTGNARLYGLSNYSFGPFAAAACLLAALVASQRRLPARRAIAVGMMLLSLLVIGMPKWGADVGGILAFAPAVLLFVILMFQGRVRWGRLGVGFLVVSVAAVSAFTAVDLARPSDDRSHLGRLAERIGDEGVGVLWGFITRKGTAAIEVTFSSFWTVSALIAIALMLFLRRTPERPIRQRCQDIQYLKAGLASACVAAVLGSAVNDSGGIIGGTAMLVVAASLVWLTLEPSEVAES